MDLMAASESRREAIEVGDLELSPVEPPVRALQRSLVSSSLLRSGERVGSAVDQERLQRAEQPFGTA